MLRQRNPHSPRILDVSPMTEADLEYLRQPSHRPDIQRLKDSHHNVARLMASGMSQTEVARVTGFSLGRLSVLVNGPAMQDLIAKYRKMVTEEWRENVDHVQTMAMSNAIKAERLLADKLDEADEGEVTLSVRELVAVTSDRYDRFGYGKKTHNTNVNVDFAANLEAAIARTKKVSAA